MIEKIGQRQELHGTYIEWIGDNYDKLYQQQMDFHDQYILIE